MPIAAENRATRHVALAASDVVTGEPLFRTIACLTAGNAVIEDAAGVTISYPLTAGQVLEIAGRRLRATSTGTFAGWL